MRTDGQIRHKLKQVIFRHRKKFVEKGLSQKPQNCKHNGVVRLPVHTANRATIHVCQYTDDEGLRNNRVCDSSMGGDLQAKECPFYESCNTPETLKNEFQRKLGLGEEAMHPGELAKEYPDIVALMWVLGTAKKKAGTKPEAPDGPGLLAFFGSEPEPDGVPDEPFLEETDE